MSGLKWTRRTVRKIAHELSRSKIKISHTTVARLLRGLGYYLRANQKKLSRGSPPERDQQFRHITTLRKRFANDRLPILSIDTKKKEIVGQFKNNGRTWEQEPTLVNDHDFRSNALGLAVPYGLFDVDANRGHLVVGASHDTPRFAVDCVVEWWMRFGRRRYPDARSILLLADNGGSNGPRCRAWKYELQRRLCDRFALKVTVAHYPPGASKWNPIEHKMFSEISKNWAGRPLDSWATIVKYARTNRTNTGLRISASINRKTYDKGQKITPHEMDTLELRPHDTLPKWNYSLSPRKSAV